MQLPSKVETSNTEGQGRPINVYFVWKIRNLKHFYQFLCIILKCEKVKRSKFKVI